jgi:hypothetical protein
MHTQAGQCDAWKMRRESLRGWQACKRAEAQTSVCATIVRGKSVAGPPTINKDLTRRTQNTGTWPLQCITAIDSVSTANQLYLWRRLLASIAQRSPVSPGRPIGCRVSLVPCLVHSCVQPSTPPLRQPTPAHASPQQRLLLPSCAHSPRVNPSRQPTVRLPSRYQCHSKHRLCNPNRRSFHLRSSARRPVFDCFQRCASPATVPGFNSYPTPHRLLRAGLWRAGISHILCHHAAAGHPLIDTILRCLLSAAALDAVDAHY